MKRILLTALSASTVLAGTMLVPSAGASVGPGHGPSGTASKVRHDTSSPLPSQISSLISSPTSTPVSSLISSPVKPGTSSPIRFTSLGASISAVKVIALNATFSPPAVTLAPGEPLIIIVSHNVRARLKIASGGALVYDGHDGNVYLFFAKKAGMSVVSAQVGPRCQTKVCTQWRTAPDLMVTTF